MIFSKTKKTDDQHDPPHRFQQETVDARAPVSP